MYSICSKEAQVNISEGQVKSKYLQLTHKYVIYIPKTVQEALDEDSNNRDTLL